MGKKKNTNILFYVENTRIVSFVEKPFMSKNLHDIPIL